MSGAFAYVHARPDGTVFYVGKGTRQRAFEMSAGRRSKHHQRIVTNHLCDKRAKEAMRRAKARVQLGEVQ